MTEVDNKLLLNIFTMTVFVGVVVFVFFQLSTVYTNTAMTVKGIDIIHAEQRLALANLDRAMYQLSQMELEKETNSETIESEIPEIKTDSIPE